MDKKLNKVALILYNRPSLAIYVLLLFLLFLFLIILLLSHFQLLLLPFLLLLSSVFEGKGGGEKPCSCQSYSVKRDIPAEA